MKNIILRYPVLEDKEEFLKALNAEWEKDFDFAHYWKSLANEDFVTFCKILPEFSKGLHIPKEHVPCTFLLAFNENGNIVGRTSIRHFLTDHLLRVGGHIGYGVVPNFRRQGYATAILDKSLEYVKSNLKTIDRVLVTCDEGNIGSQKTIENNGGILENIIEIDGQINKMRYWIDL